jgi:hypothetical protein
MRNNQYAAVTSVRSTYLATRDEDRASRSVKNRHMKLNVSDMRRILTKYDIITSFQVIHITCVCLLMIYIISKSSAVVASDRLLTIPDASCRLMWYLTWVIVGNMVQSAHAHCRNNKYGDGMPTNYRKRFSVYEYSYYQEYMTGE